jgi:lysozyme family protein
MVMSFNPKWRDKAIDALICDDVNSYVDHGHIETLYQMLYSGFKGYQEYTDEELETELKERDISTVFGDNDD